MKRVLIVSPNFPPVNAPDMQRVRMSLPHYGEFGWRPTVLTVKPEQQNLPLDSELVSTLPSSVDVVRTGAIPLGLTRPLGIGSVALRAFGHLYRAGVRLMRDHEFDLVYFSTTAFPVMALGRLWKRRFGVPYVIDLQDPWFSTYYDDKPSAERPPKYAAARWMHSVLEPWTMREVDGVISVSPAYLQTLRERYPWLGADRCATIPFGASERDVEIALQSQRHATPTTNPNAPRGVYVGRGGPDMATALQILFRALASGRAQHPRLAGTRLSFIGTDYAPDGRARPTIKPVAESEGIGSHVIESTARVPYLDALRSLCAADFLVLTGSDDSQYSPSKIYPYILAGRPIVAVVHERSPIVDLIRRTRAGIVVTFKNRDDVDGPAAQLLPLWLELLNRLPAGPETDWSAMSPFSARQLTARQCLVFDSAVHPRPATAAAPCIE
jgi:Glycosyl transferase 4-like domain